MVGVSFNLGVAPYVAAVAPPRLTQATQPRVVESTARGTLETSDHRPAYDSSSAVLQLVKGSAQQFTDILRAAEQAAEDAGTGPGSPQPDGAGSEHVDVLA
jgi:hypothetical protein